MASVLMFNISDRKTEEIRILSIRLNFTCRVIPPSCQNLRIRDLLDNPATACSSVKKPFREEMLVMDGFSHPDLNFLLNELIRTGNQIALKAVVTPVNREWSAASLYTQLVAENREMHSRRVSR